MSLNKRNCKNCGVNFQKSKPLQYCCSVKCSIEYAKRLDVKKNHKEWLSRKSKLKESVKTRSDINRELQSYINELVRLIDFGQLCISSQRTPIKCNAGHFYSVGAHPQIRFNLFNIFLQSEKDNSYLSGNQIEYMNNLELIFGSEVQAKILKLPLQCKELSFNKHDLQKAIDNTKECIAYHKKNYLDIKISSEMRLKLRSDYQTKIGLYPNI